MTRKSIAFTAWDRVRAFGQILLQAGGRWHKDNAMQLSAAVAMYSILSLSPLLIITTKILSLGLSVETVHQIVDRHVQDFLGLQGASAVKEMIAEAWKPDAGVLAVAVSAAILLFTSSGVFVELRDSLNTLWGLSPRQANGFLSLIRDRLLSIGMVLSVGFLLLASQIITTVLAAVGEYVAGDVGLIPLLVSTLLIAVLFALLFRFLPEVRIGWRYVWPGAVATAVLFKVGQYLQALYFTYGSTASAYGAAGSFVVVMLWVYYSAWIFFYGAELIQVLAIRHGERIGAPGETHRPDSGDMSKP